MAKAYFEQKRCAWAEKVRLQKESDPSVSVAAWCREHQIDYNAFLYWRQRFELGQATTLERQSTSTLLANAILPLCAHCGKSSF